MSKYTTELRYICEVAHGLNESKGFNDIDEILDDVCEDGKVIPNYPIFDENYREALNKKILLHYYTREISEETVGLWKLRMKAKLGEIMPYFNQLYKSELEKFNPFHDVDMTMERLGHNGGKTEYESHNKQSDQRIDSTNRQTETKNESNRSDIESAGTKHTNETTTENSNISNGSTKDKTAQKRRYSDTPQGSIAELEADRYLTNATLDDVDKETNTNAIASGNTDYNEKSETKENRSNIGTDEQKGNANEQVDGSSIGNISGKRNDVTKINSTEQYIEHVFGKRGGETYSKLLKEFRETFLNIDLQVIDALNPLFFGLW